MKYLTPVKSIIMCLAFVIFACSPQEKAEDNSNTEIPVTTSSDKALASFNTGRDILEDGNSQKSRAHFDKAIELDPEFTMAYILRSNSSVSNEEFRMDTDRARASMANASEGEQLMVALNQSFIDNDDDKSQEIAKQLVALYPTSPRAYVILGQGQGYLQDFSNERASFEKAIELAPGWAVGYRNLGMSLLFNEPKNKEKAIAQFQKETQLNPKSARAQINLGDGYRAQGKLEEAKKSYTTAINLDPTDPIALTKRGHANTFLGYYEEAREDYTASQPLSDFEASAVNFIAFTYLYQGDGDMALASIETAADDFPLLIEDESRLRQNQMACLNSCAMIALHYDKVEHINEVLAKLEPVGEYIGSSLESEQALKGSQANILRWQGLALAMEGNYDAAEAKLEEAKGLVATAKNPRKFESYHMAKGYVSLQKKEYDQAIDHLKQANPYGIYAKYLLAVAQQKAGNMDESIALMEEISDNNFNGIGYALVRKEVKTTLAEI